MAAEGAVFFSSDRKPIRMIGTAVDTTARHNMQEQRERALHDLAERVKELTALHATARLLQDSGLTTSELLRCLVELLPPAWQHPEVTEARAMFAGTVAATPGFRATPWMLSVPFRTAEEREGVLEVVYLEPRPDQFQGPFLREELDLLHSLVEMLVAYFERQHHAEMQRRYAQALARAQEEERRHIARELHDSVSQTLYAMSLATQTGLSAVREDASATEEALAYLQKLAASAIADMRALIFELRPQMLNQEGLVVAVERLVGSLVARHRVQVHPILPAEPQLDLDKKEALYRILQECFNNITRHAHAHAIGVSLTQVNGRVKLEVTDDGVGFNPASPYPGHMGLVSMRERAAAIGAGLSIQSAPGQATRVIVEVPS
jgi:signal transduction histidine kinase